MACITKSVRCGRTLSEYVKTARQKLLFDAFDKCSTRRLGSIPRYNQGLSGKGKKMKSDHQYYIPEKLRPKAEVLFGINPVLLALKNGRRQYFHHLYLKEDSWDIADDGMVNCDISKIKDLARERNVKTSFVQPSILSLLSGDRPHQGVCLDASKFPVKRFYCESEHLKQCWRESQERSNAHPVWLFLYEIQDPMNLGAILRSANFLGVEQVILTSGKNSCKMNAVVSKASVGAMEVMSVNSLGDGIKSCISFVQLWKDCCGTVVGTSSSPSVKSLSVSDYCVHKPVLLIMGNEGYGVNQEILEECDTLLTIIPGGNTGHVVESLNVSVTTGILLHSLLTKKQIS